MPASSIGLRRALPGIGAFILLLFPAGISAQETPQAASQEPLRESLRVGPGVGYEFGVPLAIRRDAGGINRQHGFSGAGESYNHTLWFGGAMSAPRLFGPKHGLLARLGFSFSSGHFQSQTYTASARLDSTPSGPAIIRPSQQFEISSLTGDLRLDLLWSIDFQRVAVTLGPWASYRLASSFSRVDSTLNAALLPTPLPARTVSISDTLGSEPLHGGVMAGLAVPLGSGPAQLQWELYTRFDATAGLNFRGFSAGTGLSFLLSGASQPTSPTSPEPPTPRPSRLAANVHLRADGGDSAVVRMRDILQRRRVPMLPFIFFDATSPDVPARFAGLDRLGAMAFELDSLAGLDRGAVYHRTLDIIGFRLRRNPSATISLAGSTSSGEAPTLARERAERVRRYLTGTWGIAESRITVTDDREGWGLPQTPGADRSVRITSSSQAVLAPVMLEWLARDLSAPAIGVDQEISAEAGVRSWTMTITQGSHLVGRYTSGDEGSMDELSLSFLVEQQESRSVLDPLVAELIVEDSTGRSTTARDSLPIIWRRDTLAVGDELIGTGYEQYQYTFTVPAGLPIRGESGEAAREIAAVVRNGAAITTYLPAAGSRAEAAERRWGTATSTELIAALQSRGISVDRFQLVTSEPRPLLLPEEALFARELRVMIEQRRE